jgi:hypothetical protein
MHAFGTASLAAILVASMVSACGRGPRIEPMAQTAADAGGIPNPMPGSPITDSGVPPVNPGTPKYPMPGEASSTE